MRISLKMPLFLAAGLIIIRIFLEELILGADSPINNLFGVAWLYFLMPVYLAIRLRQEQAQRPFIDLIKNAVVFAFYTRLMVMITYWLAYAFSWSASRFAVNNGGVVGSGNNLIYGAFPDGMPALYAIVLVPITNIIFWIIPATILAAVIGGIALLVLRGNNKN